MACLKCPTCDSPQRGVRYSDDPGALCRDSWHDLTPAPSRADAGEEGEAKPNICECDESEASGFRGGYHEPGCPFRPSPPASAKPEGEARDVLWDAARALLKARRDRIAAWDGAESSTSFDARGFATAAATSAEAREEAAAAALHRIVHGAEPRARRFRGRGPG